MKVNDIKPDNSWEFYHGAHKDEAQYEKYQQYKRQLNRRFAHYEDKLNKLYDAYWHDICLAVTANLNPHFAWDQYEEISFLRKITSYGNDVRSMYCLKSNTRLCQALRDISDQMDRVAMKYKETLRHIEVLDGLLMMQRYD